MAKRRNRHHDDAPDSETPDSETPDSETPDVESEDETSEAETDVTDNPPGSSENESEKTAERPKRIPEVPLGGNVPGETDEERKHRVAQLLNQPIPKSKMAALGATKDAEVEIPHGSTALPEGQGEYHPNESIGSSAGERQPTHTAPYLDHDTHDFGPNGGLDECQVCGLTRDEIAKKASKLLTIEELEHPDVKNSPLLPPRIR